MTNLSIYATDSFLIGTLEDIAKSQCSENLKVLFMVIETQNAHVLCSWLVRWITEGLGPHFPFRS